MRCKNAYRTVLTVCEVVKWDLLVWENISYKHLETGCEEKYLGRREMQEMDSGRCVIRSFAIVR